MKQVFRNAFNRSVFNAAREAPTATNPIKNAKKLSTGAGGFLKKNYNPKDPFFVKDTDEGRSINNLFTGYKLGGKGNIAMTGSLLGGGTIIAANPKNYQNHYNEAENTKAESDELDVESLQSTRGDMQGYSAQIGANTTGLSTSGDLVFAMHKTRHSGQF